MSDPTQPNLACTSGWVQARSSDPNPTHLHPDLAHARSSNDFPSPISSSWVDQQSQTEHGTAQSFISPISMIIQQEILLNWLNEQIIKPNNNSPVLKQVKDLPYDGPLDVPQKENEITQVELIQCFSQERTDACSIVQLTTGDLKESEQSLSLTNEELNGLLMKPDFQEMMKSLKQQASNSAQFGKAVESYKIQGELLSSRSYSTMRQKLSFQITHSYVLSSVANTMVINP
ncbi:hypothetical protein PSTT_05945 [Puccinia striiformis]|uniref:Uncharacterized protein n=1 Tax=Puccinia striiformis TaxID=27350 RepID=A0A2S4VLX5_9BASI|nr:hypothetical protein PSTT_05945 [Puccinia striiformis]